MRRYQRAGKTHLKVRLYVAQDVRTSEGAGVPWDGSVELRRE
jgi:hypothetical protein